MKWFAGSISEAVATSKARKAIFVVFVEGKDDTSIEVARTVDTADVSSHLERDDFVPIRLESGSDAYRFFVQIYQLVPVPSLFFIGDNGVPLEIIAGNTTPPELVSKINTVLTKAGKNSKNLSAGLTESVQQVTASTSGAVAADSIMDTSNTANVSLADTVHSAEEQTEDCVDNTKDNVMTSKGEKAESCTNLLSGKTVPEKIETNSGKNSKEELTEEEKIRRATQLIQQRRKEHEEEEQRKERERELERRKMGRDMQKLRQKQQDLEIRQAHQETLKERAETAAAREKVRQQIAQDKLERKQRELALQQQKQQQQQSQEQERIPFSVPNDSSVARIQFRLPSGNPHMQQFEPTTTLRTLRSYVVENIDLPFRQFAMCTSFPRRDLTTEDDSKTLLDLELVPTAVVLILPVKNPNSTKAVATTPSMGFISRTIWTLFAPFIGVYNYLMNYFSGGPRGSVGDQRNDSGISQSARSPRETVSPEILMSRVPGLLRRQLGNTGGTTIRAQGNIHRLYSGQDDDDENNTWNGNSTEQM